MTKVCVYAIAKNEEQHVDRFMHSAGKADSVFVLDTGSTDGTVEKLRKQGAVVVVQEVKPWRFDVARNLSIQLCPPADVLFSLDLDEVVSEPDWKRRLTSVWQGNNRGRYRYIWSQRQDGSDGHSFTYEKIHTKDYEWYLPCHEMLRRRGNCPGSDSWANIDITVRHLPDGTKSRGDYLGLLKVAVEENPDNDRMAHYYGRELFYKTRWEEAAAQLETHLKLKTSTWVDERCSSMSMIAKCHEAMGNETEAERWHFRACGEAPHLREPFVDASRFYNSHNRFPLGWALAKRALQIEQKPVSYITRPDAWNESPYDLTSTAAYYIGMKAESLVCARKAYELAPWDERLKTNLEIVERMSPEMTQKFQMPTVVVKEPWADDPSFGLVISTYGSVPYVHLALEIRKQFFPDVPVVVVDDHSNDENKLINLCQTYGADFRTNEERLNHTRGDVMSYVHGLRWAHAEGLDMMVKMSRRFVPKEDWRPSLRDIIGKTMHATYAGILDSTWGLRTECIGMHVARWFPHAEELKQTSLNSPWIWVEKLIHDHAIRILPWGVGGQDGVATWGFPGLGKWIKTESHLWHDTADPKEYAWLAQELGLDWKEGDFR